MSGSDPGNPAAKPKGQGTSRVLGLALLGVVAIAGAVVYRNWPERELAAQAEAARPLPPDRPRAKRIEPPPDSGEFRTRLAILHIGKDGAAKAKAKSKDAVALARPSGPQRKEQINGSDQSLLARELFRQALLIAARDELGLTTRDEVLDGAAPDAGPGDAAGLEFASVLRGDGGGRVTVRRVDAEGQVSETLLRHEIPRFEGDGGMFTAVVPDAEALSRSEFPKFLKGLGLEGSPNRVRADAPTPDAVEERLAGLGMVETFSAIRDIHAAIRGDGESPARLGALARGYAQLGVLAQFHWHPAHKAFKARALLYAERLVARDPKSAEALRSRGFVRALIGLPGPALEDMKAAEAGGDAPAPGWAKAIELYARDDDEGLKSIDGAEGRLAALLRLFALEYPIGNIQATHAARDLLKLVPDCYFAYDVLSKDRGLNILHWGTVAGPSRLSWELPPKLTALKDLPTAARAPLDRINKALAKALENNEAPRPGEPADDKAGGDDAPRPGEPADDDEPSDFIADEVAVVDALDAAGTLGEDAAEPGWGVLAHLVRETRFVQTWRRLNFMAKKWSVPVDEYWQAVRPLVEHHRYRPALELSAGLGRRDRAAVAEHIDATELEPQETALVKLIADPSPQKASSLWWLVYLHGDAVIRDLSESVWAGHKGYALGQAQRLLKLAPHSAYAMAMLVKFDDWPNVKDKVATWRGATHDAPRLLETLAHKYSDLKQYDDARETLAAYIRQFPEPWAYKLLAANYKAQGDLDHWRSTLKEFLETTEDSGLEHARVQVDLANDLMARKKWAEARPYAEAAAETWAGWAMQCAGRCAEGMEDWEAAETWYRRNTERYPAYSWNDWYAFCMRTGHGDLAAAREGVNAYIAKTGKLLGAAADDQNLAFFHWSSKDLKKAATVFGRDFEAKPTLLAAFGLAMTRDELGDAAGRDAAIAAGCKLPQDQGPKSHRILELLRDDLAAGGTGVSNLAEIDQVLESIPIQNRAITEYFVGHYLLNRGKPDRASTYFQHCVDSPTASAWVRMISADRMRSIAGGKGK
jgi:tetratricopeptide (TPR) repeat protein